MGGKQLSFFVLKQLTVKMERDILGKKKKDKGKKKKRNNKQKLWQRKF